MAARKQKADKPQAEAKPKAAPQGILDKLVQELKKPAPSEKPLPMCTREKVQSLLPFAVLAVVLGGGLLLFNLFMQGGAPDARCANAVLADWRDSCYYSLAQDYNDSQYCLKINGSVMHDACINSLAAQDPLTPAPCPKLADSLLRDLCYLQASNSTSNTDNCGKISNTIYADQCFANAAFATLSPVPCANIRTQAVRQNCVNRVYSQLAIRDSNPNLCRNLEYPDPAGKTAIVDACYYGLALNKSNTAFCAPISNATVRAECASIGTQALSCEQSQDATSRDLCFYARAIQTNSTADCAAVSAGSTRDNCYYQLATRTGDLTLCEFISSANVKAACTGASP